MSLRVRAAYVVWRVPRRQLHTHTIRPMHILSQEGFEVGYTARLAARTKNAAAPEAPCK